MVYIYSLYAIVEYSSQRVVSMPVPLKPEIPTLALMIFKKSQEHFDKVHSTWVTQQKRGSEITDAKTMKAFLAGHVFDMSDFARTVKEKIDTDPKAVFFIDTETSIPFKGGRAEPIEISVVDGNGRVIVDQGGK